MIDELISSGIIGEIKTVTCNLSYPISNVERIIRPELAGGALLDIGVYGINFIIMHLGKDFKDIDLITGGFPCQSFSVARYLCKFNCRYTYLVK